jgi:CheY-like chemotaxis protein
MFDTDENHRRCDKLLVVEENDTLRYLLKRVFEKYRWTVNTAHTSQDAVEAFDNDPPHLVILEPALDKLAHWSLLTRIGAAPFAAAPPIILATFLDFELPMLPPHIEACINVIATFIKPYDLDALRRAAEQGCMAFRRAQAQDC